MTQKGVLVVGIIVCIAGIIISIYYHYYQKPWFELPDVSSAVVNKNWKDLEATVEKSSKCYGNPDKIIEAEELLRNREDEFDPLKNDDEEKAIELLVEWHKDGGGLGNNQCYDKPTLVGLLKLSDVALAAASNSPEDDRLVSALHLAQDMRRCGKYPISAGGIVLFIDVLEHFLDKNIDAGSSYHKYRPVQEELFLGLCMNFLCDYKMIQSIVGKHEVERIEDIKDIQNDKKARWAREIFVFKHFYSELYLKLRKSKNDTAKMVEILSEAEGNLPKSNLVRGTSKTYSKRLENIATNIKTYELFLENSNTNKK